MKLLVLTISVLTFLSGCSTTSIDRQAELSKVAAVMSPTVMQVLGPVENKKASEVTDAQRAELQKALSNMEAFCTPRLTSMEKDSERKSRKAFWLSVAGAISGSVIAPGLTAANAAANSAAIAALSGFGGATNFLSQSLTSSGNSGAADATTRNAIVSTIWQKLNIAFDEQKSIGERLSAVDAAKAACVFYSIQVPSITSQPSGT